MATLTTVEIARIRDLIGDNKPTTQGRNDLTDTEIQAEWDLANGHSSLVQEYLALWQMIRRRWGIWINATDTETEQGSKAQSQKVAQIKQLLDFYEGLAGVGAFTMNTQAGVFDFGLDQDDPITGEDLPL